MRLNGGAPGSSAVRVGGVGRGACGAAVAVVAGAGVCATAAAGASSASVRQQREERMPGNYLRLFFLGAFFFGAFFFGLWRVVALSVGQQPSGSLKVRRIFHPSLVRENTSMLRKPRTCALRLV